MRQFTYLETYCQDQEIDGELEFLILASDGLWDVVPNEVSVPSTKWWDVVSTGMKLHSVLLSSCLC